MDTHDVHSFAQGYISPYSSSLSLYHAPQLPVSHQCRLLMTLTMTLLHPMGTCQTSQMTLLPCSMELYPYHHHLQLSMFLHYLRYVCIFVDFNYMLIRSWKTLMHRHMSITNQQSEACKEVQGA